MNKLEEYKNKKAKRYRELSAELNQYDGFTSYDTERAYQKGFDAVIALDLPVKFSIWMAKEGWSISYTEMEGEEYAWASKVQSVDYKIGAGTMPIKQNRWSFYGLFRYWLDNVYKPE